MTIYITQDKKLHDDADGFALTLPSWPQDAREATQEEIDAIQNPSVSLEELKAVYINKVDDHISEIYNKFTRFDLEYRQRESAARAFKDAGYVGDATVWVEAFADNAGKSLQQATDLIIYQADTLRAALENLAAIRMRKYGITAAVSAAAAQSIYSEIIADSDAIAATL